MRRFLPAAVLLAGLLAGCGSQTKTVTVTGPPPSTTSSASATPSTTTTSTSASQPSSPPSTATTHTAPEPAFTETEAHPEGATQAASVVRERGYTPENPAEYHSNQTLRVIVGTRSGSSAGTVQQAFFFVDGRYLGTDTKEPSGRIHVVSQSDTEVAIAYSLYRQGDALCCPSGGQRIVHFALNDGALTALDPIPPAHSSAGLSRG